MLLIHAIQRAQEKAPVDVRGLARELGVRVHEAWLDKEVSGELVPLADGQFQVNLNAAHSPQRRRFTLAHELGHFVHHRHLIGTGIGDDRAYRSTGAGRYHNTAIGPREETEANRFASNLLMPQHLIERLQSQGVSTPEELATHLDVSVPAMRVRLGLPARPVPAELR